MYRNSKDFAKCRYIVIYNRDESIENEPKQNTLQNRISSQKTTAMLFTDGKIKRKRPENKYALMHTNI